MPAFGWNFPNVKLAEAFEAARDRLPNLTTRETTLTELERSADGRHLTLADGSVARRLPRRRCRRQEVAGPRSAGFRARENGFAQAALVCDLDLGRPIGGTSIEFHYRTGPFTLVPAGGNRANLVWIDDRDVLKAAQEGGQDGLRARCSSRSRSACSATSSC